MWRKRQIFIAKELQITYIDTVPSEEVEHNAPFLKYTEYGKGDGEGRVTL